jgi:autotransporter translocation and assembly factor TamB
MAPGAPLTVNEPRGPRLRPPRRRLIRWSLVGLAGLALLLGAGVATAWVLFRLRGPELIRAELEGALVTALGRPARVDAVTFRPWPVALRVSGVAVASGASWEQGTLLRLDHGDVSVRLESLWRRRLVIGVTLTGVEVTATAAGGGGLAIPIPPDTVAIGPVTARLAVVRMRQGRILYQDPDAPWTVEVRGLDADGRPQPDALTLSAAAESLRFESPAVRERVERVRAEGTIRAEEVAAQRVRFRWEGHEAELSGQLRPTPAGLAVRGTVRGEASLVPIVSRAGMTWPLTGIARFDATLEGPVAAPRVEGRITVPELAAGPFRAQGVRLEGSFGDGTLHLRDIRGDLPGGPVRGAFTLSPDRGAGARRARLTLDGLRLPGVIASLGPANVQAEGRLEGGGIELGPVTARWAAARLDITGRVEPGGRLGLRANLDADLGPLARAMGATGVAGPARVTAETTGTWDRPVVAGQADVGPLTLTTRTVDRVELRYRLESSGSFSRWTGTLEAPRVALAGVPIEGLRAAVALDAERVEVQRLTGRVRGSPLAVRGTWDWGGDGWADGDLGPVALGGLPGLPAGVSLEGSGEGRFRGSTQRGTVSVAAAIGLLDISLGGIPVGRGRLDLDLAGRDLTAALEFPAMGLSATGHGRLEDGRTFVAQARLERADLDPIVARMAPAARGRVLGHVSARAEAEVPLGRPEAIRLTGSITPDELVVAGGRWTTRSPAVIRWDRGRLTVDQLRAEGPPGTITASAVMEAGGSDARIAIGLEQARLPPPFDRATPGEARGEARLTRTGLEAVSVRGRWPAGTVSLDGRVPFEGPIALSGRLTADAAEVARALGRDHVAGQAMVSADLSGSWREPVATGRIEATALTSAEATLTGIAIPFRLTPSTIRITDARALLGKDSLALEGDASWATGGWRGRGTLTAPVLTVGGWPIEALHAAFRMDAERLEATAVSTRVRGVAVRGTGSWQWSGGGRLEAQLGPTELTELRAVPSALDLAGSASGRLEAGFRSLEDVTGSLALRFDGVRAAGEALGAGTLAAELRGRAVRAELGFPGRRLSAVAEGRAETGATMRVRAAVDDLPLGELGRRFGLGERAMLDGSVSARLLAEVPLDHPRAGRGTLHLDPLRLVLAGEALASQEPIIASFDAGALRVERLFLEGRAGTITGRGVLHAGGALDAELQGRIPLGVLAALRPEVEGASGILDVRATVRGTTSAPEISGVGALDGASVTVRGYAEPVREIQARLTASPAGLRLIEARGVLGGGTLAASGEAALADGGLGAYRVALTARRIAATPVDGLSTLWDGDLELVGRATRGLLQGELRLVRGIYTRELAPAAGGPRGSTAGPPSDGVALPLRIAVKLDDNLVVRNRTASLRIGGTLSVEGSTAAPAVLGVLETREGRVTFRDRRFTILTATARFVDPRRVDPFLDATATARIREYDVTARVSGRIDRLDVRLSSTPPLPQEDLLALVAFGVTRAELEQSPAGVLAEEAARTIVHDLLGLEGLPGLGGAGGEQRLQVGTRTAPERTTPGSAPGTESAGQQRVRVEYQLLGPLSLVGERGMSGGYAAGVVLRLRFR